jgi:hypothetical protein
MKKSRKTIFSSISIESAISVKSPITVQSPTTIQAASPASRLAEHLATEIPRLWLDKNADVDKLIKSRDEKDLDTETYDSIFHTIGLFAANIVIESLHISSVDAPNFARGLQSRIHKIAEGFSDALERHAEPGVFGDTPLEKYAI